MAQQRQAKSTPSADARQGPKQIETARVRQGEAPGRARYLLLAGMALVVATRAIIYLANFRL
jgi:hypothetical protein